MFRCLACFAIFAAHTPLCSQCFTTNSLLLVGERLHAEHDGEAEITDARTLSRAVWQSQSVPAYPGLTLKRGALVVVVGPPGSGKSSMVTRALDSVDGVAAMFTLEEPGGPSLAGRFARLGAKREGLLIISRASVDQLASVIRERKIVALGIDSVQRSTFEARDLRHLLLTLPSLSMLFAVSQVTKDGDIRGSNDLRHEADVVVEVDELKWHTSKSRYQEGESGNVLRSSSETVVAPMEVANV